MGSYVLGSREVVVLEEKRRGDMKKKCTMRTEKLSTL